MAMIVLFFLERRFMSENNNSIQTKIEKPAQECSGLTNDVKRKGIRIKNTTYLVGMHFDNDNGEPIEDKMKGLIIKDILGKKRI